MLYGAGNALSGALQRLSVDRVLDDAGRGRAIEPADVDAAYERLLAAAADVPRRRDGLDLGDLQLRRALAGAGEGPAAAERTAAAHGHLRSGLGAAPADAVGWLRLTQASILLGRYDAELASAYAMSLRLAPNSIQIAPQQLDYGLLIRPLLPRETRLATERLIPIVARHRLDMMVEIAVRHRAGARVERALRTSPRRQQWFRDLYAAAVAGTQRP